MSPIFEQAAAMWRQMRDDYGVYLEAHIAAAVEATNGCLFSKRALSDGITETQLFSAPRATAQRWASPELLDFWASSPRVTLAEFEQAWVEQEP